MLFAWEAGAAKACLNRLHPLCCLPGWRLNALTRTPDYIFGGRSPWRKSVVAGRG